MKRKHTIARYPLILSSLLLVPSVAQAQETPQPEQGFALNRFNPSERGSEWFSADSLDMRGHLRPALGLTLDWAHKPLVQYAADGTEKTVVIDNQLFAHAGASLVLWDQLRLGVSVPFALAQSGEDSSGGGVSVTAPSSAAIGDLRLGADVRLYGAYGGPFTFALGAQVFAPTGSREQFTGDGAIRFLPRALVAGDYGMFTYAASLGVHYRSLDEGFAGKKTGTELTGGVSAGIRAMNGALVVGPELFGSAVVASSLEAALPTKPPVELLVGGHYTAGSLRVGAGIGPGLTRGLGAPAMRVLGSIEYVAAPDIDTDRDGILNKVDACVTVPGVAHALPKKNGCPSDRDDDGIYDRDDACAAVPGLPNADKSLHGCPVDSVKSELTPLDRDRDRVRDEVDRCVDVPGLKEAPAGLSAAQKKDWEAKFLGCPEDIDGDKIANIPDACPRDPGQAHKDPARNGCPLAIVTSCEIKIMDRIYFRTQSDKLETAGDRGRVTQSILSAVADILRARPEITKVEIQGHASQDGYAKNQVLSEDRAASVMKWLIERGIDPSRLTPRGYGTTKPAQGVPVLERKYKELHQRVEFHINEPKCEGASGK